MVIFYSSQINDLQAVLTDDEYIHCVKSLRKRVGDEIPIIDGKGGFYKAEITQISKKEVLLKITSKKTKDPKKTKLHIAMAPTKNMSRFEWFLEKATELGVDEITPFTSKYSERKHLKIERCEKIILSATKQSKRYFLPKLNPLTTIQNLCCMEPKGLKFIAHYQPEHPQLLAALQPNQNALILVGPEGDFHNEEYQLAVQNGFKPVNISENRLRTETAGVLVTAIYDQFCLKS